MTIKREIMNQTDVQSFAVSAGSLLIPFVWDLENIKSNFRYVYGQHFIDSKNNKMLGLPWHIYNLMYSQGLLRRVGVTDQLDVTPEELIYNNALRDVILGQHLVEVQIRIADGKKLNKEDFEEIKYVIKIVSDRVHPIEGELIPFSTAAKMQEQSVPAEVGITDGEDPYNQTDLLDNTSKDRDAFFRKLDQLTRNDKSLEVLDSAGPFFADPSKEVYGYGGNRIIFDGNNQSVMLYTNKLKSPKISYDGQADVYKSEARLRIYSDPAAVYKKGGLSENPDQEVAHSTFMTPVRRFNAGPMTNLANVSEDLPYIMSQFSSILGG